MRKKKQEAPQPAPQESPTAVRAVQAAAELERQLLLLMRESDDRTVVVCVGQARKLRALITRWFSQNI